MAGTPHICCAGEVMVELAPTAEKGLYRRGVAGDTFNTAVYLARLGHPVKYLTRLGDDPLSGAILDRLRQEGIDASQVPRAADRQPGLYVIDNDDSGERHFYYWREHSPARELFDTPVEPTGISAFFFSGITLAVCRSGLDNLTALLRDLGRRGCPVVFDPNYRPDLWRDREQARAHYRAVVGLCDTVLATLEDDIRLWDTETVDESRALYRDFEVSELVIRAPDLTAHGFAGDEVTAIAARPVSAIDTTGAGDAFNAGYLAARLRGRDLGASIEAAQVLAATVVQHPGAITPLRANG